MIKGKGATLIKMTSGNGFEICFKGHGRIRQLEVIACQTVLRSKKERVNKRKERTREYGVMGWEGGGAMMESKRLTDIERKSDITSSGGSEAR